MKIRVYGVGVIALLAVTAQAQTLTEHSLGSVKVSGTANGPRLFSPEGNDMAIRERVGEKLRYVTLSGPGELFDELGPSAGWVKGRLVYYGRIGKHHYLIDGNSKLALPGKPTSPNGSARPWVSADRQHYAAFSSDGREVSWYQDGKKKSQKFKRLGLVQIPGAPGTPAFVAYKNCSILVAGFPVIANEEWDMIHSIKANATGNEVLVHGEKANLSYLNKNGKTILQAPIRDVFAGDDLATWYATVDRPVEGQPSMTLIKNGLAISTADVDFTRQVFYSSANAQAWAWHIFDEDYIGVTVRYSNGTQIHSAKTPSGFVFSHDGSRHAYFLAGDDAEHIRLVIDDQPPEIIAGGVLSGSFVFGPVGAYGYVVRKDGKDTVITHRGAGPQFDAISAILFLPDGTPAYAASSSDGNFIVVGEKVVKTAVDNLHFTSSLRLAGSAIEVMGTRGTEVVAISVRNN
ncbi:hypothetical protein SAMN05216319_1135 [Duganella sp. CF402]|uniref:hypothetical protein n=1 Tax=unclassified Duganella TaxID=2636909 RepID=UPI0008B8FED7|nr:MULTISPECIES: hypothetical protein [unclassified Duganella]RZT10407.1 hypothetical protein EV582_2490 [Duganella sp. BK701]SEL14401.1 hypothetical protein SAMN05216319_1135 [Duganella sp. CF402]